MPDAVPNNNICFVISPIGDPNSDIRKRSDQVLKHIITPAAKGYEVIRADRISEPGDITTQVIEHLLNDPIVVADLTGQNANVFYELAVRHLLRLPYVQLIQRGEKPPFDTVGIRTIPYDLGDPDSVEEARNEVQKQIAFTTANKDKVTSPMSIPADRLSLSRSGDPVERGMADIMLVLSKIQKSVEQVRRMRIPSTYSPQNRTPQEPVDLNTTTRGLRLYVVPGGQYVEPPIDDPDDALEDLLPPLS